MKEDHPKKSNFLPKRLKRVNKRNIISYQEAKKTRTVTNFPLPDAKPLAERLIDLKPENLKDALEPLKSGVAHAATVIKQLQQTNSTHQQTHRINDTIHLLKGLQKAIEKETTNHWVGAKESKKKTGQEPEVDCPLQLQSEHLLMTLHAYIQALESLKSRATDNP